jgi:hypothetical protein
LLLVVAGFAAVPQVPYTLLAGELPGDALARPPEEVLDGGGDAALVDPRGAVVAAGGDQPVVGAEGRRVDRAGVAAQLGQGRPVAASQTRAVRSSLAVITRLPSGLNAAP